MARDCISDRGKAGCPWASSPLPLTKARWYFPTWRSCIFPRLGGLGEGYMGKRQHVGRVVPRLGVLYCTGTPGDALLAGRGCCCCISEVVLMPPCSCALAGHTSTRRSPHSLTVSQSRPDGLTWEQEARAARVPSPGQGAAPAPQQDGQSVSATGLGGREG